MVVRFGASFRRSALALGRNGFVSLLLSLAACQSSPLETGEPAPVVIKEWTVIPAGQSAKIGAGGIALTSGGATASNQTTRVVGTGDFIGTASGAGRRQPESGTEDGVVINFVNVPVAQAAKVVLGDILGVEYVIDGKVDGKLTIQTPEPVAKRKALALFRAALSTTNAQIVESGGVYRVVGRDQAAAAGMTLSTNEFTTASIGDGANVVQLRYVSAGEMKRILEPIAPKGGILQADEARGVLTLAGSPQEMAAMRDAIRVFDVDTMKGMSFALVPVKSAEPEALVDDLKRVFGSEMEGPMNGMIRFVPNKRLKSILIISPQPRYMDRAEAWVRKLDARAAGSEKQLYTYTVQNRSAKELASILNSIFAAETAGGAARQVAPRQDQQNVFGAAFKTAQASTPAVSPFGATAAGGGTGGAATGRTASDATMASTTDGAGGGAQSEEARMRIGVDDANNALLIMASPDDHRRLTQAIRNLDVMPNQVLIEATIAEVSLNDQLKFGVKWYLSHRPSTATLSDQASGAVSSVFPGFSYALKLTNAQVTVDALQEVTDVKVLSSPSLMVMDNKTAVLQVGDQVPITTQSAQSVVGVGAPIVNSVSYKDTGVILSITPRINESGLVLLDIEQEVSSVTTTTSSNIDSPTIQQRKIKTSVIVNDREAITLGGLIQEKNSVSRSQVPVFGDIPVLGNAFKSKNDLIGKTELIIILTPRVVRNTSEARAATDEFAERLRLSAPRQRTSPRPLDKTVKRLID